MLIPVAWASAPAYAANVPELSPATHLATNRSSGAGISVGKPSPYARSSVNGGLLPRPTTAWWNYLATATTSPQCRAPANGRLTLRTAAEQGEAART